MKKFLHREGKSRNHFYRWALNFGSRDNPAQVIFSVGLDYRQGWYKIEVKKNQIGLKGEML
jgi:hypothetical protein